MEVGNGERAMAGINNLQFDLEVYSFLCSWIREYEQWSYRSDQYFESYIKTDALRDFFIKVPNPLQFLLSNQSIAEHLTRREDFVYFDPLTGDPLYATTEQRIYNLARMLNNEQMHIPFRSMHPKKQTPFGDNADISIYSGDIHYNSGNHFSSRAANWNVFKENSRNCVAKATSNIHVLFKRGYMEERLLEVKVISKAAHQSGETRPQFFVICSRHSLKDGHFGVALVAMDPAQPDYPRRILVCDTLLKDLPQHPRWWNHFIEEFTNVFGPVAELIEDISHPLQKVNVKGDHPYRHDWDCPYYTDSLANALVGLLKSNEELITYGCRTEIHDGMKNHMPDYYHRGGKIKDRAAIEQVNRIKRWRSGMRLLEDLSLEVTPEPSYHPDLQ